MGTALFSLSHSGLVEREHRTGRERKLSSNRRSGSLARAVVWRWREVGSFVYFEGEISRTC